MNNHFSLARFTYLLRLALFQEQRRAALIILASLGVALLLVLLVHSSESVITNDRLFALHSDFFIVTLFIGGYLFAGSTFPALRQPVATYRFLMLPASALEKLLAYWLLSTLLYPLVYLAAYWGFSLVVNAVAGAFYPAFYRSFALEPGVWRSLLVLSLTQSVFVLGAALFRKVPLIKTFLYASGLTIGVVLGVNLVYGMNTGATFFRYTLYLAPYWLAGLALLLVGLTYGTLAGKEA